MRSIYIGNADFEGCCAIRILYGFPEYEGTDDGLYDNKPITEKLTDEDWFNALQASYFSGHFAMYIFSNSSSENTGKCTPALLARWLRRQGEKVSTGFSSISPASGNKITLYSWAPSKKFIKNYENHKNKKNKKDAERGSRAA